MSSTSHDIKPEDAVDMSSDEDYEEEYDEEDEQTATPSPAQTMLPTPAAPPQGLTPSPQPKGKSGKVEVPAFFQNNGLVMRNADGLVFSNEATLPAEKSFTIQVGPEQFRMSGASLQSDAPSYFTRFFEAELAKYRETGVDNSTPLRTLYVDRDPETFRDISLHLQGYHVQPRNATHYVRLYVDAQFYMLPRLTKHLLESDVFMRIGEEDFCIPRDLFDSPGNNPNYFTLGFSLLFSTPGNPFPGLDVAGLLRPPAIKSAAVSGRSSRIFADLLDLLRGYEVSIRDEAHRAALLCDCRYYHFRGIEQRIIPHSISWNTQRAVSEIVLRVGDLRQSGISLADETDSKSLEVVRYARPFTDDQPHELIMETGKDSATIRPGNNLVVEFYGETRRQIMSLFKVLSTKFAEKLSTGALDGSKPEMFRINEDGVANARIEADAVITVDGEEGSLTRALMAEQVSQSIEDDEPTKKRRRADTNDDTSLESLPCWTVIRSQWRIRLEAWSKGEQTQGRYFAIHLYAVNLDLVRGEKGRNRRRGFLDT